jgi:hypothetical protein
LRFAGRTAPCRDREHCERVIEPIPNEIDTVSDRDPVSRRRGRCVTLQCLTAGRSRRSSSSQIVIMMRSSHASNAPDHLANAWSSPIQASATTTGSGACPVALAAPYFC